MSLHRPCTTAHRRGACCVVVAVCQSAVGAPGLGLAAVLAHDLWDFLLCSLSRRVSAVAPHLFALISCVFVVDQDDVHISESSVHLFVLIFKLPRDVFVSAQDLFFVEVVFLCSALVSSFLFLIRSHFVSLCCCLASFSCCVSLCCCKVS